MEKQQLHDESTADVLIRNINREGTLFSASMALVPHYMAAPFNHSFDDAKDKVDEVADYIYENHYSKVGGYRAGIKRQKTKLLAAIDQMVTDTIFAHFTGTEATIVKDILDPPV